LTRRHIMLDLETMGTGPTAAIVAIGAVSFEPGVLGGTYYCTVDLRSSVKHGGVIDPDTVLWWLAQSEEARGYITEGTLVSLPEALDTFSRWLKVMVPDGDAFVWGSGAAFDNVVLAAAYRSCGVELPWSYKRDRCYRTLRYLHPDIKANPYGTEHNALDDAVYQARHAATILAALEVPE